jgi:hypothetical protein
LPRSHRLVNMAARSSRTHAPFGRGELAARPGCGYQPQTASSVISIGTEY